MLLTKLYIRCKLFLQSKEGASGIEYAVIAAMVAVALAAFVTPISEQVTALMNTIQTAITPKS
ncbi:Flp family type IVb pilin [Pseudomonas putida]|uniref:Flp family type IVb pilin n=1 Tax=Pseudomonas TaxID=286 RepID=UPI00105A3C0A|nr:MULTISPECIES: Flp family type IVb pilin [Pseudomonas]MBF8746026.1 Flp family type IVb pilin [Pseudomonas monteilii]MCT8164783.1 Flp family type IVb pilin [Pseudomonas sp. HD6422]MCT8181319.1 Flp family type IVb pilin [Pseudomonas sp. HD6421]TDJ78536.1 Flp family type IVb pilin [Pseudomonas putida]